MPSNLTAVRLQLPGPAYKPDTAGAVLLVACRAGEPPATAQDRAEHPKVALASETAARRLWSQSDSIGQIVSLGPGGFNDGAEVIGVVSDVRYNSIESAPVADVYIPVLQSPQLAMQLFVRSRLATASLAAALDAKCARWIRTSPSRASARRTSASATRCGRRG